jgi:hypothetical protein
VSTLWCAKKVWDNGDMKDCGDKEFISIIHENIEYRFCKLHTEQLVKNLLTLVDPTIKNIDAFR